MLPTRIKKSTSVSKELILKLLLLPCETLLLAIQIEGVQKIIRMPEIYKSGQKVLGLAHFDDREAIVIDLYQKLYNRPNPILEKYLIIIKSRNEHLFGIPAITLPTLISVPESELKELPSDYRDRDALGIASHVITTMQKDITQTIFLLDPLQVFQSFSLSHASPLPSADL